MRKLGRKTNPFHTAFAGILSLGLLAVVATVFHLHFRDSLSEAILARFMVAEIGEPYSDPMGFGLLPDVILKTTFRPKLSPIRHKAEFARPVPRLRLPPMPRIQEMPEWDRRLAHLVAYDRLALLEENRTAIANDPKPFLHDIATKAGMGFFPDSLNDNRTYVIGRRQRIRTRVTLACIGDAGSTGLSKAFWGARAYFAKGKEIELSHRFKHIPDQQGFAAWYRANAGRVFPKAGLVTMDAEEEAIAGLAEIVSRWTHGGQAKVLSVTKNLADLWHAYLQARLNVPVPEDGKRTGRRRIHRAWEEGVRIAVCHYGEMLRLDAEIACLSATSSQSQSLERIVHHLYDFFRRAEMLNYPVLIAGEIKAGWSEEFVGRLREYVERGGFLYVDHDPLAGIPAKDYRQFVSRLTTGAESDLELLRLSEMKERMQSQDRKIPGYALHGVSPDPFSRSAWIGFEVPVQCDLRFEIFDAHGGPVRSFVRSNTSPGIYYPRSNRTRKGVFWNGRDVYDRPLPSGTYFVRMTGSMHCETRAIRIANLRQLDPDHHLLFTSFHDFNAVPACATGERRADSQDPEADSRESEKPEEGPYANDASMLYPELAVKGFPGVTHGPLTQAPGAPASLRQTNGAAHAGIESHGQPQAYGFQVRDRTALVYTEWSGILQAMGVGAHGRGNFPSSGNPAMAKANQKVARRFFANVLVFALSQDEALVERH